MQYFDKKDMIYVASVSFKIAWRTAIVINGLSGLSGNSIVFQLHGELKDWTVKRTVKVKWYAL